MSKTVHYIGHYDLAAEGKILWEILCQLKNLGVGRYITKTEWQLKWPEQPSYIKIVKARPDMDRWLHRGEVWAEWTFRGRVMGLYRFKHDLNRPDWKLVHKHDEQKLFALKNQMEFINLPDTFPVPPLQILVSKRNAEKSSQMYDARNERAPLKLCIDPQFDVYKNFIKQMPPKRLSSSIYDEVDSETYLQWYGNLLPTKVQGWAAGPVEATVRFKPQSKNYE